MNNTQSEWENKIPTDPESYNDWSCDRDGVIDFIQKAIDKAVKEARKELVEEIKEWANTTPPNLLLNTIIDKY